MTQTAPKKSDLGERTLSAIVMLAVAGGALWAGGWVWSILVFVVAAICLYEFGRLVWLNSEIQLRTAIGLVAGFIYIALASAIFWALREPLVFDVSEQQSNEIGFAQSATVLGLVVATDVGAYFAGRTFGGPKIAPRISPSKTWAGLLGGMLVAGLWSLLASNIWGAKFVGSSMLVADSLFVPIAVGAGLAAVAQAGDFFESWLKRRAGVKDSSRLIPGHGGVFDRVDGLLAVCFAIGLLDMFGMPIL